MWDKEYVKQRKAQQREAMRHPCPRCGGTAITSVLCRPCSTAIANKQRNAAGDGNYWQPKHTRGENGRYR